MNTPDPTAGPHPSDHSKNPYVSPSEAGSAPIQSSAQPERRHPLWSVLGWLLAVALTGGTAYFVFLSALLIGYPTWDRNMAPFATAVFVGYGVVFTIIFAVMLVVVRRESPFRWLHVLPSVLWTQAFLGACEFLFFIMCSAAMR